MKIYIHSNEECAVQFIDYTKEGKKLEELSSTYKDNFVKQYIMSFVDKDEKADIDSKVICHGSPYIL